MNIFVLDNDPVNAARQMCNKHIVKMVLESAQLLCSPFPENSAPYKRTHYNHPCAKWIRETSQNYQWLLLHAFALCDEYNIRYYKTHKSSVIIKWAYLNYNNLNLPSIGLTPFPQCMPEEYKVPNNAVQAYRNYYINEKQKFAKWKNTEEPDWFKEGCINKQINSTSKSRVENVS